MARVYFEETQVLGNNRWVWVFAIAFSLVTLLPILNGLYWQLAEGEPWGNKPMSDNGLIALFLTVLISWSLAAFFLLTMKLETKIDEQGFHYKFFPLKPKWHLIPREDIATYKIEKSFRLFDGSKKIGYHRNIFTNTRSFRILGKGRLFLNLKNGQRFIFGTQNPDSFEHAITKMIDVNEII
jgi:hypothetical protein